MNSNYAAARWLPRNGADAPPASEPFAKLLRSTPTDESTIVIPEEPVAEPAPAPVEPPPRSRVPHFLSVAESLQYPRGPYRQAPPEHGGEWWLTNPFTGLEPWITQGYGDPYAAPEPYASETDPEFLAIFGPRPTRETHPNPLLRSAAAADWERNREHFKGTGVPEGFTQEQIDAAGAVFEAWGMGRPVFYEGRYGWTAQFPSAEIPAFEAAPFTALEAPHLVVARYQVELAERGATPSNRHPFTPPQVFEEGFVNI